MFFQTRDPVPPADFSRTEIVSDQLILPENIAALQKDAPTKIFMRCRSQYWASVFAAIKDYVHSLTLDSCLITDQIVKLLADSGCRQLAVLRMPNNRISDESLERLKNFWRLKEINLDGNPKLTRKGFTGMMRERGNNIEKIEMLLPSTKLEIRKNELLQTADLYLRNKGLEAIARNFPNLTELNVASDSLQSAGALFIAQTYPRLTSLDIRSNDIGDEGAMALADLRDLVMLSVATNRITNQGLRVLGSNLPLLKSLDISTNYVSIKEENPVGDEGAAIVGHCFPSLLLLFMDECEAGNEGLLEISKNLRYLEWIHFSNNHCDSSPLAMMGRSLRYLANARLGEKLDVHTKRNLSVFLPKLQLI